MTGQFSFSFGGDDIDEEEQTTRADPALERHSSATGQQQSSPAGAASAFPVQGKPLLPPTPHGLDWMLSRLPSRVAYNTLAVDLDGKAVVHLPRRELWDVRVQLMAEEEQQEAEARDDSELEPGLGKHDVKTGIYEGGFKSWESSVDLVKVLASEGFSTALAEGPCRVIELGCGTGLPSLALFQWATATAHSGQKVSLDLILADYNPTVLYLVTLPNFIISWALQSRETNELVQEALSADDGELEITPELVEAFKSFLIASHISLSFCSGAWSSEFVELLYSSASGTSHSNGLQTLILGAETIYSPYALASFSDTVLSILQREKSDRPEGRAAAIVGAKKLYFGVGGSLDDFVERMRSLGTTVDTLREEVDGVRRGVVRCVAS
ncbi:hypothetical protein CONLIGDRAFT_52698 [Coniochaeta ligniaria NRRL 30616]|uniref:protein-histidine N-methyltransferase n=1 Tax=Coniochaeta ligniaria NRRL 30616 TaxID=1408157 RepID=A0A1J7JYT5_9PEZI|nr:hypothetical protein CONLIGDRAFT_52698 [Coniochaeta ligniaria NRRL 30616]